MAGKGVMLNEKPTFLSKIRTVSCGDILWAFFLPTMRIDIGVINVYHPARLCLSLTQHVSPLCQPNTRQLSTIVFEISNKISISDVEFCQFKGGGGEITLPYHFFKKKLLSKSAVKFLFKIFKNPLM